MFKNKLSFRFFHLAIFVLIVGLIWVSPISAPRLNLVMSSDAASQSQLYRNQSGRYSEQNSETIKLSVGDNNLAFSLYETSSPVRWDPAQGAVNLMISDAYISIGGVELPSALLNITPANQISSIKKLNNTYTLLTTPGADDPQTFIELDTRSIVIPQVLFSLVLTSLIYCIVLARKKVAGFLGTIELGVVTRWRQYFLPVVFSAKEFFIVFFIATVLNSYFITNLSLSIDDEWGAVRTSPDVWISQGRWAIYLIEKYLLPLPAIPFLPYLILDMCLALSYVLVVRAHGGVPGWKSYLTFPVYCSFPTWWLISEFSSNVPAAALGWLLVTMAACASIPSGEPVFKRLSHLRITAICSILSIAVSCYQSLILLYLSMTFGILLCSILSGPPVHLSWLLKSGLRYTSLASGGLLVYLGVDKVSRYFIAVQDPYLEKLISFNALLRDPLGTFQQVLVAAGKIYFGSGSYFGASIGLAPLIIIAFIMAVLIFAATPKNKVFAGIILLAVLMTPFLLHVVAGANGMPMRTLVSLAYVAWLMVFLLLNTTGVASSTIFAPLVILYIIQLLGLNSQYIASASLTQRHDELLAADIYRRMGEIDAEFDSDKIIRVDFFGHRNFKTVYANVPLSAMQGSFFDWDNGNITRMLFYMTIQGYPNLYPADQNTRKKLTPFFSAMPVWPAAGSVIKVDNVYLVRLSKDADPAHE